MTRAVLVLVGGVALGGCGGGEGEVRVPDVELISRREAGEALERAGLRWRFGYPRFRWDVPPWRQPEPKQVWRAPPPCCSTADDDLVYDQDPEPGERVDAGAIVVVRAMPCWQPPDPPEPVEGCID